jgi:hypothetical protein
MLLYRRFVEFIGLPAFDSDGSLRAVAKAGPQSVAKAIRYQTSLAVDYLNSSLGAGRDTIAAAVALLFIDMYYLTNGHFRLLVIMRMTRIGKWGDFVLDLGQMRPGFSPEASSSRAS